MRAVDANYDANYFDETLKMPSIQVNCCPYVLHDGARQPLNLQKFSVLHAEGRHLVQGWFDRAYEMKDHEKGSFEGFIFAWFSVNGWAACVTNKDRDSDYIRTLERASELRNKFSELLIGDTEFLRLATLFHANWPIFKAQDIRRAGQNLSKINDRQEIIQHYFKSEINSYAPECWQYHERLGEATPLDWPHTLNAIYRVRNNLFHGEKSAHSEMDRSIVYLAFQTLIRFFRGARIL